MTKELIAKLEALDGRNNNGEMTIITSEIGKLFGWHRVTPSQLGANKKQGGWIAPEDWIGRYEGGSPILDSLHGTTIHRTLPLWLWSLDAAIKLVPKHHNWSVQFSDITKGEAWIFPPNNSLFEQSYGTGESVAIALLICILKAREAKQ